MWTNRGVIRPAAGVVSSVAIVVALAATAAILIATGDSRAWGDGPEDCEGEWNPQLGICIEVAIPGTPGATPTGGGGNGGGGEPTCHDEDGSEVPCTKDGLTWWGEPRWCYASPDDPQPAPDNPVWEANGIRPEDGQFWTCCDGSTCQVWWVPNGDDPVDPGAIAGQLRDSAPFELANAQIAPPPTYHTYINYLNWLWIPQGQWHEVSVSLTVAGARVTLTAKPTYVSWDMGNGESLSCVGPGRAWVKGMPEDAPTNCSFAYSTMQDPEGDTWSVSARINYTVGWTCTGSCGGQTSGDLGEVTAVAGNSTSIAVLQRQTVVTQ